MEGTQPYYEATPLLLQPSGDKIHIFYQAHDSWTRRHRMWKQQNLRQQQDWRAEYDWAGLHLASGSSARMRRRAVVPGWCCASFWTSHGVSKVVRLTPIAAAALMSRGRLQAFANTMSLPGHAPAWTAALNSACKHKEDLRNGLD